MQMLPLSLFVRPLPDGRGSLFLTVQKGGFTMTMAGSTRATAEARVEIGNDALRLSFDPRTSDTMYNYIDVRRRDTGQWERVHNFGIDVRGYNTADGQLVNTIGMNQKLNHDGRTVRATYPDPLIVYRQFDDKIGSAKLVRQYPDFTDQELKGLVRADGSLEFTYEIDAANPSFTVRGRVLSGRILNVVYIISALWTDNHALPTHEYIESFPEWDTATPDALLCRDVEVQNVAYAIFYRHDGNGVPFALLPATPTQAGVCNYYDNWKCLFDFRASCLNQQYIPRDPAVKGSNDTGCTVTPDGAGSLPGVRVAFFPELAYLQGGLKHELRKRIVAAIKERYFSAARAWNRAGKNLPPMLKLSGPLDRD